MFVYYVDVELCVVKSVLVKTRSGHCIFRFEDVFVIFLYNLYVFICTEIIHL